MGTHSIPSRLWCFGLEQQARLMHFILRGRHERSGYEMITGKTPDTSEYLDFDFYDLVWYWRGPHPSLSKHDCELASWMGAAHRVGSDMCYWLMPVSGIPVVNSTIQHITAEDLCNPDIKSRIDDFNTRLMTRLDDMNFVLPNRDIDDYYTMDIYEVPVQNVAQNRDHKNAHTDDDDRPEADDIDSYDRLIGTTFLLDPLKSLTTLPQKRQSSKGKRTT